MQPTVTVPVTAPVILYVPVNSATTMYDRYPHKTSITLGVLQIVFGGICIIFDSISIGLSPYFPIGHGIWNGILFVVTGSLGCSAAYSKTKCMVVSYMVMCIISASLTTTLLSLGIVGAIVQDSFCRYGHRYYCGNVSTEIALQSCLAIIAVIEAVLGIYGAVICCKSGVCCCATTPDAGVVQATNNPNNYNPNYYYPNNYHPNTTVIPVMVNGQRAQVIYPGAAPAIPYGQQGPVTAFLPTHPTNVEPRRMAEQEYSGPSAAIETTSESAALVDEQNQPPPNHGKELYLPPGYSR